MRIKLAGMRSQNLTLLDGINIGGVIIFCSLFLALLTLWVVCLLKMSSKDRTKIFFINLASKASWFLLGLLILSRWHGIILFRGLDQFDVQKVNAVLLLLLLPFAMIEGYIYKKVINYTKIKGIKLSLLINAVWLLILGVFTIIMMWKWDLI